MKQFLPAVIQPITTSITEVTIIRDGFFFNIKQANNKLVKGRSLRKTLYLKQEKETISQQLISEEFCCTYKQGLFNNTMMFFKSSQLFSLNNLSCIKIFTQERRLQPISILSQLVLSDKLCYSPHTPRQIVSYCNFRSFTCTANYPHRPIIAYSEKKVNRLPTLVDSYVIQLFGRENVTLRWYISVF